MFLNIEFPVVILSVWFSLILGLFSYSSENFLDWTGLDYVLDYGALDLMHNLSCPFLQKLKLSKAAH